MKDDEVTIEPMSEDQGSDSDVQDAVDAKVKKQKTEIERLKDERQEYLDGWQRSKADYVNALSRFEKEKLQAVSVGKLAAFKAFMPAIDSLDRAAGSGSIPEEFAAIAKQLNEACTKLDIQRYGAVGDIFNPMLHEALGTDEVDGTLDNLVTVVLEQGYKSNDFVIRPAKVRVGHHA